MKHLILVICSALALSAGSINLLSGVSAGEWNNSGTNMLVAANPGWAVDPSAQWISFENTGWGGMVVPNTDLSTPTAVFYQNISMADGTGITGSIHVWADDTATVKLDGVVLFAASPLLAAICTPGPIGCTQADGESISFSAPGLNHTLEFDIYQRGLGTFGLMYDGVAQSTGSAVPEPAAVSIVGAGLAALGLLGTPYFTLRKCRRYLAKSR